MSIAHKFVDFPGLRYYHNRLKESIESEMEEAYAAKEDVPVVATSTELSNGSSTEPRSVTPKLIHDYVAGEVSSGIAGLVNSAPAALDTLNELASALGNDPNFATTVSGQIGSKLDASSAGYIKNLSIDGKTITYTRGDSTTGTLTTQDTTYTPASEAPKAPASTAAVGTSVKYAREDHVHPVQTTITGNAGTATKFASAQTVKLEGDVSGSASSQAGWTVSTELAASGVTAGSYGPSADSTPGYGATFDVPSITVDAKGRVTSASTKTVKIPASDNVDTKVAQTATGTSDTGAYPILLKNTTATDTITDGSRFVSGITVQPSTGTISATKFSGAFSGNASSATEFSSAKTVELTGDVAGSASSKAGWSIATTLANSGVTAGSYGPSTNATPGYGATFDVPSITVDAKGRVTSASTKTVKIPASDNVDTKVNVTLGTTTKAYLLGTSTTPTSTATGVTAVSDTGVYLDTTEGRLTAGSFAGDGQNITFGSANAVVVTDASKKLVSHSSVTTTELGYLDGVTSSIQTQLNGKADSSHNQASSTINAMTGYSKPSSTSAIGTSDTLNAAIGKLEKALDGKAATSHGTHVTFSTDAPAAAGTASAGGSSTVTVAKSDHVHPLQTTISGNAGTATKFASSQTVALTGDVTGSASSQAGWSIATTLADSGVTAGTIGNDTQQTPSHGGTFNIPYVTVDSKGRITAGGTTTVKLPADNNTDTKVNVTLGTTTKAYLLGTSTTPTSTAAGVTAISDTGVYLDTTAGRLTAGSFAGNVENGTLATANAVVVTDANKKLTASTSITATELGYLDGVTSSIQTQLNAKAEDSGVVHTTGDETIAGVKTFTSDLEVQKLQYLGDRSFSIGTQGTGSGTYLQINSLVDSKSITIANQGTNNITLTSKGNITATGTITGNKIVGDGSGLTNLNGSSIATGTVAADRIANLDASKITSGTIDIARLPAGALERLVTVANQTARFALTTSDVQLGDTVRQSDTGLMYYVVDTSKLNSADGYAEYTAGAATSVPWSGITSKPSTFTPSAHNQASNTINAMTGYSKPSSTSAIGTSDTLNAAIGKLEKALDGKQASGTYLTPSSTLDATKLSGTIPSACYTDTVYTHPTTSGNKHVPSGGSSGQFLGWSADGTAAWVGNPNWTTHLYAGAASNATANATTATTNAATYIVVCDNSSARNAVQVTGTNGTTVSAVNGKLTIDSVSLSAVTNAEIDAAIFA